METVSEDLSVGSF